MHSSLPNAHTQWLYDAIIIMPVFAGEDISQIGVLRRLALSLAFGVFTKGVLGINIYGSEGKEVGTSRGRSWAVIKVKVPGDLAQSENGASSLSEVTLRWPGLYRTVSVNHRIWAPWKGTWQGARQLKPLLIALPAAKIGLFPWLRMWAMNLYFCPRTGGRWSKVKQQLKAI